MKDVFGGEPQSQSGRDAMIRLLEDLQRPRIATARRHPAAVGAHRQIPLQNEFGGTNTAIAPLFDFRPLRQIKHGRE